MTPLTQAVSLALLHFIWQGAAVALVTVLVLVAMRGSSAKARYAVSCGALALLALLPVITTAAVYSPSMQAKTSAVIKSQDSNVDASLPASNHSVASGVVPYVSPKTLQAWVLPLWTLGFLFFSLRMLSGWRDSRKLMTSGVTADLPVIMAVARLTKALGMTRPVRILISTRIEVPSVLGFVQPLILVPAATLAGLTTQQLEAVIAHELAHILRYDHWFNLAQTFVETALFYHPAVWWISSRIRHERELCCDDLAVATCGDALCYARALTAIEKRRAGQQKLVLASNGGSLLYRIARITGRSHELAQSARHAHIQDYGYVATTLLVGLLCIPASLLLAKTERDPRLNSISGEVSSPRSTNNTTPVPVPPTRNQNLSRIESATSDVIQADSAKESQSQPFLLAQVSAKTPAKDPFGLMMPVAPKKIEPTLPKELQDQYEAVTRDIVIERGGVARMRSGTDDYSISDTLKTFNAAYEFVKPLEALRKIAIEAQVGSARLAAEAKLSEALVVATQALIPVRDERMELELAARPNQMVGRVVHLVAIVDIPEAKREELRAQLPVRPGQELTQIAINQATHVLRDFDPNLRMLLIRGDGRDVDFIVSAKPR